MTDDLAAALAAHVRLTMMDRPFTCTCEPHVSDSRTTHVEHVAAALRPLLTEGAAAYVPVVQEFPHGFYGGTRRTQATRATVICRHTHQTRQAAEACADELTAIRNSNEAT